MSGREAGPDRGGQVGRQAQAEEVRSESSTPERLEGDAKLCTVYTERFTRTTETQKFKRQQINLTTNTPCRFSMQRTLRNPPAHAITTLRPHLTVG